MNAPWPPGATERTPGLRVEVLEGCTVQPTPAVCGAMPRPDRLMRAIVRGAHGALRFDDELLSKHVLFLGGIGTGKTNAMMGVLDQLRGHADPDDVFIVFDSKRDFHRSFYCAGDAVLSNERAPEPGAVLWNVFADISGGEAHAVGDEIYEIASTIFAEQLSAAGDNLFFAAGARDVFAAVFEALYRSGLADGTAQDNRSLRAATEGSSKQLWDLITAHDDLAGAARYLAGGGNTPEAVRAFLQQSISTAFSGNFRRPGEFSVRRFVRGKGAHALFIEYDIAAGARLLPVYRSLIDLAIKEALTLGRAGARGSVYFVMDEFALVPQLQHMSDGINFGRSLGLKFIVGTQHVGQVLYAYGPDLGRGILAGFGTVFGFRLLDDISRDFVRQRFGTNRKQLTTDAAVRANGVRQETVLGNVIEDWTMAGLDIGQTVASLPTGPPFFFAFNPYRSGVDARDDQRTR